MHATVLTRQSIGWPKPNRSSCLVMKISYIFMSYRMAVQPFVINDAWKALRSVTVKNLAGKLTGTTSFPRVNMTCPLQNNESLSTFSCHSRTLALWWSDRWGRLKQICYMDTYILMWLFLWPHNSARACHIFRSSHDAAP